MRIASIKKIEEGLYDIQSEPCIGCRKTITVQITARQLWAYNNHAYIEEVLPDETPAVREQFISGTCGICWDKMFPQDKEEEWFDSGPIKKEMLESWLSLINKEE